MNISLDWLSDYLPQVPPAADAAEALTMGGFPVEHVETVGTDAVLDVEVTSNRPDLLSHLGVARELAALMNLEAKLPDEECQLPKLDVQGIAIQIAALGLCPHYTARVIRSVKIAPSPDWLRRRLEAVGVRPINNVVDVTNYVMLDLGQPLHAFDLSKIGGGQIIVRRAEAGETLVSIDGHERKLTPDMLVIADAEKPVALAGVMGGLHSEVTDATVDVLLEAARFDPLSVRKTARTLAMQSDSSYRFERGLDPTLPARAGRRAAEMIVRVAGGEIVEAVAEAGAGGIEEKVVTMRLDRLNRLLGVEFPRERTVDALKRLGFGVSVEGDALHATVPSHRLDVNQEVDLIEEVARAVGYDAIPTRETINIAVVPPNPEREAANLVRRTLAAAGWFEAITFSFVADKVATDFLPPGAAGLQRVTSAVRRADAGLRPSVLPGLLESLRRNEAVGVEGARLFETGSAFWLDAQKTPQEHVRLALVGGDDLRDLRGAIESVLTRLDAGRPVRVEPARHPGFGKNACGRILWGEQIVGHLGMIDRAVADKLDLRDPPPAAELDHAALIAGARPVPQLVPLATFPPVRRDVSFVVSEPTRFADFSDLINGLSLDHLEAVEYVTTYRGKPLAAGTKSVTLALAFRAADRTLTGAEIDAAVSRAVEAASRELGATVRT